MKFIDTMRLRYSTKIYDPSKRLSAETISEIEEILRLSPSSINSQPWRFTIVTNTETKSRLAENSYFNREKIESAQLLVVFSVCDDLESFERQINSELPQPNVDYYNSVVRPKGIEQSKCWLTNQLYIALGVLLSACATMHLDSTPMEGINSAGYNQILNNNGYNAVVAVAIGFRSTADGNQPEITPKQRRNINKVIDRIE